MDEDLEEAFEQFGEIVFARVVIDKKTQHNKGKCSKVLIYF